MEPHAKLFISSKKIEGLFGDGKWLLLKAIKKHGSIQKAAHELGRSYRKAWGDIKRAEQGLGHPLVTKIRGGTSGGSTRLTDFGLELLKGWKLYQKEVRSCMKKSSKKYLKKILNSR